MPRTKHAPADASHARSPLSGSAGIEAMVARVAPAIPELLGDGIPRSRSTVVAALAERHSKEDVTRTLVRLAVTGRLQGSGSKYSLAADPS